LVGGGDAFFGATEALDVSDEAGPVGAFEREEKFVDVAERILAAAERGLDFSGDGEEFQDVVHGLIEESIGDREKAHEEQAGTSILEPEMGGDFFAKIGAGEGGPDQFRGLAAA